MATLLRRYGTIHNAYRRYNASICKRGDPGRRRKPDARRYRAAPALHSEPLPPPGCSSWGRSATWYVRAHHIPG
ncbi:hypothetical protein M8494_35755 [Serratia ureilytica]